jgi:hypothetical protein
MLVKQFKVTYVCRSGSHWKSGGPGCGWLYRHDVPSRSASHLRLVDATTRSQARLSPSEAGAAGHFEVVVKLYSHLVASNLSWIIISWLCINLLSSSLPRLADLDFAMIYVRSLYI